MYMCECTGIYVYTSIHIYGCVCVFLVVFAYDIIFYVLIKEFLLKRPQNLFVSIYYFFPQNRILNWDNGFTFFQF